MQKKISQTQPSPPQGKRSLRPVPRWMWWLITIVLLSGAVILGSLAGYISAGQARTSQLAAYAQEGLDQQFELGVQDLETGRYEVAKQRFEYIISIDPDYPGVMDMLAQSMLVLYGTATPTALPATASPTTTRDPRPIEELFNSAMAQFNSQDWDGVIDTLSTLRKEDRAYQTASVDGMLYMALRSRGVNKILQNGNLEAGIYDLALAERFGPLDVDANQARQWARLYMIGLSFWEVHPEQAVYYFSQVAAAVPYLSDGSGWTAVDRYRAALIQYGDLLASQSDWCNAAVQYELALALRSDGTLEETLRQATERCLGQTATATIVGTPTITTTATATVPGVIPTVTPTPTFPAQQSPTPTTGQPQGTPTSSPGATNTQIPAATNTPTPEAQNTPYPDIITPTTETVIGSSVDMNSDFSIVPYGRGNSMPIWWQAMLRKFIHW